MNPERLSVGGVTLDGVASGGEATSLRVPELGVIFDIGVCLPGTIAHRYHTLLLSHGHGDHAAALPYVLGQRNMRGLEPLRAVVPEAMAAPLRTILECWSKIEGYDLPVDLVPATHGSRIELGDRRWAIALATDHRIDSLAYLIMEERKVLAPRFAEATQEEIMRAKQAGQEVERLEEHPWLCVTGDTTIEFLRKETLAQSVEILVHEVTAWDQQRSVERMRLYGHTHVDEVIESAELFQNEKVVLVHRSPRHSKSMAQKVVKERFPAQLQAKVHVFG